jgi:aminobenzoyl-glutamate utilization protein B
MISPTVLLLAAVLTDGKEGVAAAIEAKRAAWADTALEIWRCAEVGYQEKKSSARLQSELRTAGFQVEAGLAGMPTAFRASWGHGQPVIAFLAEFDALPGLSQEAVPERKTAGAPAGHGCGHHLLGTASTAAGVAVKEWLAATSGTGTVRVYGTPAEEGGGGKVYMLRAGLFDDVDAVLAWHPGDANDASPRSSLANVSAKFRFHGVSAHAAGAPERGRSALDGVEAMDAMVNLMREHVPQETRIHYVITRGGEAPNVVPDFAEVYYYARHPDVTVLDEIWQRILKAADGAALGTGTTVDHEVIHAVFNLLPNDHLARLMDANLRRVGGYRYTAEEAAFAERLSQTLSAKRALGSQENVQAIVPGISSSSTDLGDVSWVVPTAEITAATWVPGTPAHSWQATAAGGTSIGVNGMIVAAKTLAMTAVDLLQDPAHVKAARAELAARQGPGFRYRPRVGDRPPPLDYRK